MSNERRQSPTYSPLLSKALNRFQAELEGDDQFMFDDVVSVEELVSQTRALQPPAPRGSKLASSLSRLEPILSHINDFAAVIAICGGADAKAAGLVWGSLRVILTLASPAGDTLEDVLDMLDELSLSLPRFRSYEENLPMTKALESTLLDVYTEVTCFCARTINFFRSNPHRQLVRFGWPKLSDDFKKTINRLKKLSRAVDGEAEAIRLRADTEKNTELLAAIDQMKDAQAKEKLPCFYIPFGRDEQFYGREDILAEIRKALDPVNGDVRCRSFALHGMGGVGKTKIALQYVNSSRNKYDAIFWISADNSIKITQSFLEISRRLGLSPDNDDAQDAVAAMTKVKTWLTETNCRWLLVIDNADDPGKIAGAWPSGAVGSVLLTSRDSSAWFGTAAESRKVQPFNEESGISALLGLIGRGTYSEIERAAAKKIMQTLGGLPLAIYQISGFIMQQRLAMEDFLPLYERNSAKIDAKKSLRMDYEHTLSTVWALSLSELPDSSRTLQSILAFLDPDKVYETILMEGGEQLHEVEFEFLRDEMDFLDAKEALLKSSLIDRCSEDATISIHRLVQAAVMKKLSSQERSKYFDYVILLLSYGFPNTWNTVTTHQFKAWGKCEKCLPHVSFLMAQSKKYSLRASESTKYAELVLRCCWYLYEREHYIEAQRFMKTGLEILAERDTLMYASAIMLHGLIELDTNNVQTALESFLEAMKIREKFLDADDALIASSLNAISLAYTELGDIAKAIDAGQKAIEIRLHTNSERIGNSYSNMASTLLRDGKHDEAEETLKKCPSLKDFVDETFLSTGDPRFSGDMVLLARIRQRQGRIEDAIRLASKALSFRQTLLGNRLKTCDSLYQVAWLLGERGDLNVSINLLEESICIAERLSDAEGYLARANYKISLIYGRLHNTEREKYHLAAAEQIRKRLVGNGPYPEASEKAYDDLVLWMLW